MKTCKDCIQPIYNTQKSNISNPECQSDCPQEVYCNGEFVYSDCLKVNVALSCIESSTNATLTSVLQLIDTKLCQVNESNCNVKVSSTDECCGYLQSKLVAGAGITITKNTDGDNCETLTIASNPATLVWNNLQLTSNFTNLPSTILGDFQPPQYSNVDALGRIWFRGSFTCRVGYSLSNSSSNIANLISSGLPVGFRPQRIRILNSGRPTNVASPPLDILFTPSGMIYVNNNSSAPFDSKGFVTLDGFFIDINS